MDAALHLHITASGGSATVDRCNHHQCTLEMRGYHEARCNTCNLRLSPLPWAPPTKLSPTHRP